MKQYHILTSLFTCRGNVGLQDHPIFTPGYSTIIHLGRSEGWIIYLTWFTKFAVGKTISLLAFGRIGFFLDA